MKCVDCLKQDAEYQYKETGAELCSDCVSRRAEKEPGYYAKPHSEVSQ